MFNIKTNCDVKIILMQKHIPILVLSVGYDRTVYIIKKKNIISQGIWKSDEEI